MSIEKFLSNVVVDGTISKVDGTSTQFLKADGSVDSNVYAIDSNVVHKTGNETVAGVKTFSSTVTAPTFIGNLTGNASSATYLTSKGNLTESSVGTTRGSEGLSLYEAYSNGYPITYGNVLHLKGTGAGQLLIGWSGGDGHHADNYIRSKRDNDVGAWSGWAKIITDQNYNSYSPTLTGGGATGTWGINISGNAASATSWGSKEADLNDINNSVSFVTVMNPDGIIRVADPSGIQSFLGLGSNAYSSTAYLPLTGGTLSGSVTATSFIKSGGTSSQFLKADGSIDSSVYATLSSPSLTGTPTAPTAAPGTTGNQIATTDFVTNGLNGKFDKTGGTISGNVNVTGTVTASGGFFNSDLRLKNIIKRDGDVVYYTWKDGRDNKEHAGYIAQEVQENYPNQVQADEKGILSVNYVEILVEKIRLLEKRIDQLEKSK